MPFTPPPQQNYIQRIRSRIEEGRSVSPYDSLAVAIPLVCRLTTAAPNGSAKLVLKNRSRFRLQQIIPIVNIVTPRLEVVTNAGDFRYVIGSAFAGGDVFDRIYAKAHNCAIDLKFDSQEYPLNANASFRLSDLFEENGGSARFFDCPTTFSEDTSVDLLASLQDTAAADSLTEYGVLLVGSYVRR